MTGVVEAQCAIARGDKFGFDQVFECPFEGGTNLTVVGCPEVVGCEGNKPVDRFEMMKFYQVRIECHRAGWSVATDAFNVLGVDDGKAVAVAGGLLPFDRA